MIPKPRVTIDPLSLTIEEGEPFTLLCSASVPGIDQPGDLTFIWFRWNGLSDENISSNPGTSEYKWNKPWINILDRNLMLIGFEQNFIENLPCVQV